MKTSSSKTPSAQMTSWIVYDRKKKSKISKIIKQIIFLRDSRLL